MSKKLYGDDPVYVGGVESTRQALRRSLAVTPKPRKRAAPKKNVHFKKTPVIATSIDDRTRLYSLEERGVMLTALRLYSSTVLELQMKSESFHVARKLERELEKVLR